jgi:hypothetical protein
MGLPRVRFTIQRLMLAVLIIALPCAWVAPGVHWRDPLVEARAQFHVTTDLELDPFMEPSSRGSSSGSSSEPSPGRYRWSRAYTGERQTDRACLFDVAASGGCDASGLEPITIDDRGGLRSAKLVAELTRVCRERGWPYRVTRRAGNGPDSQRASGNP